MFQSIPLRGHRSLKFASLFLVLALLLSACGGGNGNTTPTGAAGGTTVPGGIEPGGASTPAATATSAAGATPSAASTTAATPAATDSTTGTPTTSASGAGTATAPQAGGTRQPGTVQISVVRGAMRETMQKLAQSYMDANPGVTVEVVEEPEGGAFEALIAAGNQPDIIVGSFGSMIGRLAEMEALAPIEEMPGAQELFGRLDENTVKQVYGHNYYVPMGADVTLMIYNKELFTEAGLDPEKPPATWDEFLSAAEKIQALPERDGKKVYGTVFWNEALSWGGWYWNMLQPIYLNANQNSCQLLNRLGTDIVFDDPECNLQAFFEFTQQAQKFAPPTMEQNFFSRTIGMWPQYGYSWQPNLETAAGKPMVIGEDVGVAPVPVQNAGDQSFTTYGGRPLMILRTTPEREAAAWQFIQFLMEDENNMVILQELGYLPVLSSLKEDPYFQDPARQPFVAALENAVFPELVKNAEDVANAIQGVYQEVVVQGSVAPEEGVAQSAQKARDVLNAQ